MSERDLVYLDSLVDAADAIHEFIGSRTKEEKNSSLNGSCEMPCCVIWKSSVKRRAG